MINLYKLREVSKKRKKSEIVDCNPPKKPNLIQKKISDYDTKKVNPLKRKISNRDLDDFNNLFKISKICNEKVPERTPFFWKCCICGVKKNRCIDKPCIDCVVGKLAVPCKNGLHWIARYGVKDCNKCKYSISLKFDKLCKGCDEIYIHNSKDYCDYCQELFCCTICNTDKDVRFYPDEYNDYFGELLYCIKCLPYEFEDTCEINGCIFGTISSGRNCFYHTCQKCYNIKNIEDTYCKDCEDAEYADLDDCFDSFGITEETNKRKLKDEIVSIGEFGYFEYKGKKPYYLCKTDKYGEVAVHYSSNRDFDKEDSITNQGIIETIIKKII